MALDVIFLGEFSSGKSAFINMLLGVSLMPEALQATDRPVVKIHSAKPAGIWLREEGQKYGKPLDSWSEIPSNWSSFLHAEATIPGHPLLDREVVLWDTPGINVPDARHSQHLKQFLKQKLQTISLVFFFLPKNFTRTSLDFLKGCDFRQRSLFIVVNIKDRVSEEDCRMLERDARSTVMKEVGMIPVHLLAVGDVCESFNRESMLKREGLSDWELIKDWKNRKIDIREIISSKTTQAVGHELFDYLLQMTN